MAEPSPQDRERYEFLKKQIAQSIANKRNLDAQLARIETKIHAMEGAYLGDSHMGGNIVQGFDGYLKAQPGGAGGGAGRARRHDVTDADRIFSTSSMTWQKSLEMIEDDGGTPAPEANTIKLPSISAGPPPKKSGRKRERATTASDFDDEEIHLPAQTSNWRRANAEERPGRYHGIREHVNDITVAKDAGRSSPLAPPTMYSASLSPSSPRASMSLHSPSSSAADAQDTARVVLDIPELSEPITISSLTSWLLKCEIRFRRYNAWNKDELTDLQKITEATDKLEIDSSPRMAAFLTRQGERLLQSTWAEFKDAIMAAMHPNVKMDSLKEFHDIFQGDMPFEEYATRLSLAQEAVNSSATKMVDYHVNDFLFKSILLFHSHSLLRLRVLALPMFDLAAITVPDLTIALSKSWDSLVAEGLVAPSPTSSFNADGTVVSRAPTKPASRVLWSNSEWIDYLLSPEGMNTLWADDTPPNLRPSHTVMTYVLEPITDNDDDFAYSYKRWLSAFVSWRALLGGSPMIPFYKYSALTERVKLLYPKGNWEFNRVRLDFFIILVMTDFATFQKFVEEVVDSEGKNVEKGLTYEDWFEMFEDFHSVCDRLSVSVDDAMNDAWDVIERSPIFEDDEDDQGQGPDEGGS
ncbi:histone acetyltransferase subunit NuA4-domain-containing protein [Schizophyllum fasciatum]